MIIALTKKVRKRFSRVLLIALLSASGSGFSLPERQRFLVPADVGAADAEARVLPWT